MLMIINVKSELYRDLTGLGIHLHHGESFVSKTSYNESLVYFELAKIVELPGSVVAILTLECEAISRLWNES